MKRLIAVFLVVAGFGLFMLVSGCGRRGHRVSYNETTACANLRTICTAQELYRSKHNTYTTLTELEAKELIKKELAQATVPERAKMGYYFTLTVDKERWCCIARPQAWGGTGTRNFRISLDGTLYHNHTEGGSEFTEEVE